MKKTYVGFLLETDKRNNKDIKKTAKYKSAILLDYFDASFNTEIAFGLTYRHSEVIYHAILETAKCFISYNEIEKVLERDINEYATKRKSS